MATINFNAANVKPQDDFSPIPAGQYIAQVTESEIKPTKNGTGQMLTLRWAILDGACKGRLVFDRINIANQNPQAEEIGQRQLSGLCHAIGVLQLADTSQLHGKPLTITVSIRKDASGQYGDSNEVKSYKPMAGAMAGGFAPAAAAAPTGFSPAPAAAAPTAPWLKAS